MKFLKWLYIIYILLPLPTFSKDNLQFKSNIVIFDSLLDELIEETLQPIKSKSQHNFFIKKPVLNFKSLYVENQIIEVLKKIGIERIYIEGYADAVDSLIPNITIEYIIRNFDLNYSSPKSFWLSSPLKRNISMEIEFKIINEENGKIILFDRKSKSYSDEINRKIIDHIQNPDISFTIAELPPGGGFRRFLQPITFIGVTGAITYLFYSFRSK